MPERQGWDAIQEKLTTVYRDQKSKHWGTIQRFSEGGPDPLDGVSAYRADTPPYWHYISFGFSELYEKKSSNAEESGWVRAKLSPQARQWGNRAPSVAGDDAARTSPATFFRSKSPFDDEHYLAWGRPIISSHRPSSKRHYFGTTRFSAKSTLPTAGSSSSR